MAKARPVAARRRRDRDEGHEDDGKRRSVQWWRCESGQDAAGKLWTWCDRLKQRWSADGLQDLIFEAIYRDEPLGSAFNVAHMRGSRLQHSRSPMNVIMGLVDTATARLTKRRPMPVAGCDDAGWSEKLFAKSVSRVIRRKMGGPGVERMSPDLIRDFIIRGTAVAKAVRIGGDVSTERVPICEIVYDPREAYYGPPRQLAHVRPVAREVLCEEFPEYAEQIESASEFNRSDPWVLHMYAGPSFADHIEIAEAWHLPSGPGADDGQHIIAIRGVTLLREPWKVPRFPLSFAHWCAPIRGLRGSGLVEQLMPSQALINEILADAKEGLHYGSQLKLFVQRGSNVIKNHLRSRHPAVIEFDGAEPHYVAPNPVSEQALRILDLVINRMHELSGISQMAAQSKNQLGAGASGKALDTLDDIQSDRFAHVEAGYMQFRCDMAVNMLDMARAMVEEAKGEHVFDEQPAPIAKRDLAQWVQAIDWGKFDIDAGPYHIAIEPINFLPDSRAGKLSFAKELSANGLIPDPTMTAALFDEPDIQKVNRSILGPYRNIERMLEGIADVDTPIEEVLPTRNTNLPLFVLMAKGEMEDAFAMKADDEVIERFQQSLEYAQQLTEGSSPPSLPGMQAANMGAAPNAATLQPEFGGGAAPMPMPPGDPGMPPTGMMQ